MSKKKFTHEELAILRSNPYTYTANVNSIYFTAEFKEKFYKLRQEGYLLDETISLLGYDPDMLGETRIKGISSLINKAVRNGKPFTEGHPSPESAMFNDEYAELTDENFLKMQHELLYLKQEIEFLKKISSARDSGK